MMSEINLLKTKVCTFVLVEELNEVKKRINDLAPIFRVDKLEK